MGNLQQTINWSRTYAQYIPITAGNGQEPAVSIATMIRNSILAPPQSWYWNRNTFSPINVTKAAGTDYSINISSIPDFGFLEKASLQDASGKIWELKDVYNSFPLAPSGTSDQQRPNSIVLLSQSSTQFTFRFLGAPNATYTGSLIYQKKAQPFGPYFITSCGNAAAGNTAYTGTFDPLSFATGATANITGFVTNVVNNGSFVVVSCTATTLTLANGSGVAETATAYATNFDWFPIPDWYQDVYNNLFLSELFMVSDDPSKAPIYRQRGVGAFLAKAAGLTDEQKDAFAQQWLARSAEDFSAAQWAQLGGQARAV